MSTGATRIKAALDAALRETGNDRCAECLAAHPRWASVNLGIFLCMRCASLHRQLGTHISRVKSTSLDSWTREDVRHMREVGNIKSNAYFNPRNQRPLTLNDDERDSELDKFIRDKYQFRKFMDASGPAPAASGTAQAERRVRPLAPPSDGGRSPEEPPPVLPPSNVARDQERAHGPASGPARSSTAPPLPSKPRAPSLPLGSASTGPSTQHQTSNPFAPMAGGTGQAVGTVAPGASLVGPSYGGAAAAASSSYAGAHSSFSGPGSPITSAQPPSGPRPPFTATSPAHAQFTMGGPAPSYLPSANPFAAYHATASVPPVPLSAGSSTPSTSFSGPSSTPSVPPSASLGMAAFGTGDTGPMSAAPPLFAPSHAHLSPPTFFAAPPSSVPPLAPHAAPPFHPVPPSPFAQQTAGPSPMALGAQAFAAPVVLGQTAFAPPAGHTSAQFHGPYTMPPPTQWYQ